MKPSHDCNFNSEFSCTVCGECFINNSALTAHLIETHGASSLYSCTVCGQIFLGLDMLVTHLRQVHEILSAAYCEVCEHIFLNKAELSRHTEECHTSPTPTLCSNQTTEFQFQPQHGLICQECATVFVNNEDLAHHQETYHSMLFVHCLFCDSAFPNMLSLNIHTAANHEASPPPNSIPISETSGSAPNSYPGQSENIPKNKCYTCDKMFHSHNDLTEHVKAKHHHLTPTICFYCMVTFTTHSELNNHLSTTHETGPSYYYSSNVTITTTSSEIENHFAKTELPNHVTPQDRPVVVDPPINPEIQVARKTLGFFPIYEVNEESLSCLLGRVSTFSVPNS